MHTVSGASTVIGSAEMYRTPRRTPEERWLGTSRGSDAIGSVSSSPEIHERARPFAIWRVIHCADRPTRGARRESVTAHLARWTDCDHSVECSKSPWPCMTSAPSCGNSATAHVSPALNEIRAAVVADSRCTHTHRQYFVLHDVAATGRASSVVFSAPNNLASGLCPLPVFWGRRRHRVLSRRRGRFLWRSARIYTQRAIDLPGASIFTILPELPSHVRDGSFFPDLGTVAILAAGSGEQRRLRAVGRQKQRPVSRMDL
jgi:hypothetical protein